MSAPRPKPATPEQLLGRKCVVCGLEFRTGEAGVVYGIVGGGPVYRHDPCPQPVEQRRGGAR